MTGARNPEILQDDVFKSFFRIEELRNREIGGTGLGLTVARSIARGHRGDIILRKRPDSGLRMKMELPRQNQ